MTIGTHPWSDAADTHFLQNVMVHSGFGIIFPTGQGVVAFCSAAIATCACAAYECKRKMIDYKTLVSTLSVNGNHAQILFVRAIRVEVKLSLMKLILHSHLLIQMQQIHKLVTIQLMQVIKLILSLLKSVHFLWVRF